MFFNLFQGNRAQRRPAALHCSSRLFSAFFIISVDLLISKINVSKEVMSLIYIYKNSTYESLNGNHPNISIIGKNTYALFPSMVYSGACNNCSAKRIHPKMQSMGTLSCNFHCFHLSKRLKVKAWIMFPLSAIYLQWTHKVLEWKYRILHFFVWAVNSLTRGLSVWVILKMWSVLASSV